MGQLLLIGLVALGGWYGYRFLRREMRRVGNELDKARQARDDRPTETLELDPKSGRYRPRQPD